VIATEKKVSINIFGLTRKPGSKSGSIWLPLVNALRNQFARPTKELIDTILVGQAQVKDGFLAAIQE